MQEHYYWWPQRQKLSSWEIKKMKENMRKVPEIKKKADLYHESEVQAIERLLDTYVQEEKNEISWPIKNSSPRLTFWQQIKNYLFK